MLCAQDSVSTAQVSNDTSMPYSLILYCGDRMVKNSNTLFLKDVPVHGEFLIMLPLGSGTTPGNVTVIQNSWGMQDGVDLYKVQKLLGNRSLVMTQRYAYHSSESLRESGNVLDRQGATTNLSHPDQEAGEDVESG